MAKNDTRKLPARADVVIIGGGIVGCSIAYHLTKIGIRNVVVVERKQLTSGTTWHAAGLVGQLRATRNLTELAKYTATLFEGLEKETGQATGFKQNGSISLALSAERMEELLRGASMAKSFGLEVDVIGLDEIKQRIPHYNLDSVTGGVFLPKDGQLNPIDVTQALAAGARSRGAKIFENVKVTRIVTDKGKAVGVETTEGTIKADKVVMATGMWSRELGKSVILSTHILQDVEAVCDAAVVLDLGRVVAQGSIAQLTATRERNVTLLAEPRDLDLLPALSPIARVERQAPGRYSLWWAGEDGSAAVFRAVAAAGGVVRGLLPHRRSLEDVFLQAVRGGDGGDVTRDWGGESASASASRSDT